MPLRIRERARIQAPFLIVLGIVLAVGGYLIAEPGHWRRGTAVVALAMFVAAAFRLTLSRTRAGLLAVRGRYVDAACYAVLGALILIVDLRLRH